MIKLYLTCCNKVNEHLAGKRLAEYALFDTAGIKTGLCYGENGKPYFENTPAFVSISHSKGLCLAALSDKELGADIEKHCYQTDRLTKLASRYFTKDEQAYVNVSPDERFYEIWCKKESYVKYTGEGLSRGMNSFSVIGSELCFTHARYGDYTAAVCSSKPWNMKFIYVESEILSVE